MSDTIRTVGFEGDISAVQALVPQAIQDATPVLSAAINRNLYPRRRAVLVATSHEVTGTSHTMAFTVTESDVEGGVYTAATTSGTLTASAATDVTRVASIKFNRAKPWLIITATGSHADIDVLVSAQVLFLSDSI